MESVCAILVSVVLTGFFSLSPTNRFLIGSCLCLVLVALSRIAVAKVYATLLVTVCVTSVGLARTVPLPLPLWVGVSLPLEDGFNSLSLSLLFTRTYMHA